ncbi:hypothetical protein [Microbulbifer sp. VAAF005]|uniref:hypothetical protein n=1 Tax=Microbulbifer sp. VAAF005 TaxID=3034230 RepID=UPI0024AE0BE5|nr:hypothetical protein [Microbulbifer sp. VAAF005]WHI45940.1 hypothetical protein P0078_19810 [Microbulbifer sp. VAAF005]
MSLFKNCLAITALLFPLSGNAVFTETYEIQSLKAATNGVFVKLSGFRNDPSISNLDCPDNNTFVMLKDTDNYEGRLSFLLSAYMAGKPVQISYYDCQGNYINISSVFIG